VTQVCSVFSQLLQLFSRGEFARAVKQHSAERNAKGFTCWGQFVAMLFCQVAQLKSLREVCMGLASCEAPLKHLGISETPKKSTLAYANEHRPWGLYQTLFNQLLEKCQAEVSARGGRKKFRFKNKLVSLDGSIIDLSASMFDWAKYKRTKGAIKLHLLLDHHGYLPSFAVVTEGKHSEVAVARGLRLEPGTILVIDRGYNDYEWFAEMTGEGVFFVTRMKTNTVYAVEAECEVPANGNVLRDQIISLPALRKAGEQPVLFRRIEYWNEEKREILVFFTNLLHLAASTIAAIYKERWQVELFFENSTWCTPSYVYGISRASCFESAVAGVAVRFRSAIHRSTSALRMTQGAPAQACVAGNCFNRISRKTVVCVTSRTLPASPTNISLRACRSPSR
jgi:hypothetical protein